MRRISKPQFVGRKPGGRASRDPESRWPSYSWYEKNGEIPPAPISNKSFSGKFVVRIPPEVHRALVIKAAEKGIILNRLVSAKLSCRRLAFYPYLTDSFFPCKFTWRLKP